MSDQVAETAELTLDIADEKGGNPLRVRRLIRIFMICAVALFLAQAIARLWTMTPWEDEGLFGDPALTLARHGYLGTQSVDPTGAWQSPNQFAHVERYFYYLPPVYELALAGWWKLFGFQLFTGRALSVLAGLLLCGATFLLVQRLSPSVWAPYATLLYLVTNYHLVTASATERQDCLATALGMCGLCAFVVLHGKVRESAALLAAHGFIAAACLTHPNAILYFFPLLYLMWRNGAFTVQKLAVSAVPYLLFLSGWGLYIMNGPRDFAFQFGTNFSGHPIGFTRPLASVASEMGRYYLLPTTETSGRAKMILTIPMLAGAALLFLNRTLRRQNRDITVIVAYSMVAMTYLVGRKWDGYLINIVPMYAMAIGLLAAYWVRQRAAIAAFLLVCGLGTAATLRLVSMRRYQTEYAPTVAFVKSLPPSQHKVMAAAELGFGLGFDRIRDDYKLGYVSGEEPDTIIVGEWYDAQNTAAAYTVPEIHKHIDQTLSKYRLAFEAGQYKVYVR